MKQIKFLAFILLLSALAVALDIVSLGIGSAAAAAGSVNVSVPVSVNNNDSIAIFEFTVNHSQYLIFRSIVNTSRMQNATIESNVISPTSLRVAAFVPNNITAGNGAILNLIFDINSSALPGAYNMEVADVLITNADVDALPYNTSAGIFTVL